MNRKKRYLEHDTIKVSNLLKVEVSQVRKDSLYTSFFYSFQVLNGKFETTNSFSAIMRVQHIHVYT